MSFKVLWVLYILSSKHYKILATCYRVRLYVIRYMLHAIHSLFSFVRFFFSLSFRYIADINPYHYLHISSKVISFSFSNALFMCIYFMCFFFSTFLRPSLSVYVSFSLPPLSRFVSLALALEVKLRTYLSLLCTNQANMNVFRQLACSA